MGKLGLGLVVVLAGLPVLSPAELRRFEPRIDEAKWTVSSSRLQCALAQEIPQFGKARFVSQHGRQIDLRFDVSYRYRSPIVGGNVQLQSLAPSWLPAVQSRELGNVTMANDRYLLRLKQAQAWTLWNELEMGHMPTFTSDGFMQGLDTVIVSLSAVRFREAAEKFRQCLAQLLPYTFADIAKSTVYFEHDKVEFTAATKARLTQIRDYLAADRNIELMMIEGHTDNKGARYFNQVLGQKRAEAVRDYLIESGVDAKRVKLMTYGERKPVTDNKTEEAREKNRRVVIEIEK
jgi:outer membrane protein OmpA-like peptidoglycan-associated protein